MSNRTQDLMLHGFTIRPMLEEDIHEVRELVLATEGLAFWEWETGQNLERSLARNPTSQP